MSEQQEEQEVTNEKIHIKGDNRRALREAPKQQVAKDEWDDPEDDLNTGIM